MNRQRSMMAGILTLLAMVMVPFTALAAFSSGSTGADGDFNPTANTVLQLPESGVFNYRNVNIPSNVTVTFAKNSRNTPVTILATGDVLINGTISVNGGSAGTFNSVGTGGPGGYDGGAGGTSYGNGYRGQGPGGGTGGGARTDYYAGGGSGGGGGFAGGGGNGGSYGGYAGSGGPAYGNDGQLPMLGGSGGAGGGGNTSNLGGAGGGGGGAILIAATGTLTVNGSITANGGAGYGGCSNISSGGGGAGGGIRLVATTIAGNGALTATGGAGGNQCYAVGGNGCNGRIRLDTWFMNRTAQSNPGYPQCLTYPTAVGPATLPTLSIASIGGVAVPAIPRGNTSIPDIQLPANIRNPVTIVVAAANVPVGTTVAVQARSSQGNTVTSATGTLTGVDASSTTASVSLNLPTAGYPSLITVSTTYTVAANDAPLFAEGERVDKIRVDTAMGGSSKITYITASGKEIPQKRS